MNDKLGHFAAGAAIGMASVLVTDHLALNAWLALVPVAAIGLGKEVFDHFHPGHSVEWLDLVATVAGGAATIGIMEFIRWL